MTHLPRYQRLFLSSKIRLVVGGFLLLIFSAMYLAVAMPQSATAFQSVPYKVNFQGRLADATGAAMPDGQYNMTFRLFTNATGGSPLWSETRQAASRVTLINGQFNVQLGDVSPLSPALFGDIISLEVELPTPASATCATAGCAVYTEGPMTPRQPLASSPFAMNSDTLDGFDSTNFAMLGGTNTFDGTNLFKNSSNSTTAFQIQNAAASTLFVADTANSRVQIGSSVADNAAVLLVLDTKNTSGDPTGVNGAMYYNSSVGKFRCYENNTWVNCLNATVTSSPQTVISYSSDFLNTNIATGNVASLTSGSGTSITAVAATDVNHPGIVALASGTTATGRAAVGGGFSSGFALGNGATWQTSAILQAGTLSNSTDRYTVRFGFIDSVDNESVNGCYLRYSDNVNSGKWYAACRTNNTQTACDTGVTYTLGAWYNMSIAIDSAGASALFTINGVPTCTVSANIPTTIANQTGVGVGIKKSVGTNSSTVNLDYFDFQGTGLASR